MANSVRFHPCFADDLSGATSYYDKISIDLGNRFRMAAKGRIATVRARAESYGRVHEQLRGARLERFPYVVIFEYDADVTQILGLFHTASDRAKWTERSG